MDGGVTTRQFDRYVLEVHARGFLRREHLFVAQRALTDAIAADPGRYVLLVDALDVDAFEPGVPMLGVRWMVAHRRSLSRMLVVARRAPITAVALAVQRLLPFMDHALFATRADAVRALHEHGLRAAGGIRR
jgi:hypothetical protein